MQYKSILSDRKFPPFSPIHQTFSDKKLPHLDVEQGRELKKDYSIKSISMILVAKWRITRVLRQVRIHLPCILRDWQELQVVVRQAVAIRFGPHTCVIASEADIILARHGFPSKFQTAFELDFVQTNCRIIMIGIAVSTLADSIDQLSCLACATCATKQSFSLHQIDVCIAEDMEIVLHCRSQIRSIRPFPAATAVFLFNIPPIRTGIFRTRNHR